MTTVSTHTDRGHPSAAVTNKKEAFHARHIGAQTVCVARRGQKNVDSANLRDSFCDAGLGDLILAETGACLEGPGDGSRGAPESCILFPQSYFSQTRLI